MIFEMLNKLSIVDLTHDLSEQTPVWPDGIISFKRNMLEDYDHKGYRCYSFSQSEGVGTHMDSPMHFTRGGRSISDLNCKELVAPAVVIDVRKKVNENCDYKISAEDINYWEKQHGKMPEKAVALGLTGWDKHWQNTVSYLNQDKNNVMHFPGFSKEAADLLIDRKIRGVGIDTLSIDAGFATELEAHKVFLGNDKYQVENLTNLDKLPANGAVIFILPIKILNGAEAPARVIAVYS